MSRPLVVVSTRSFGTGKADPQGLLEAAGCRVEPIAPDHDLGVVSGTLREAVGWIAGSAPVTEAHFAAAPAVADHAIGLALAALRDTGAGDRAVRSGDWSRRLGRELGACRVGIVGYGTIGRLVRRRLVGFGSDVVAHDPYVTQADVPLLSLEELVSTCDVVTLHLPATGGRPVSSVAARALSCRPRESWSHPTSPGRPCRPWTGWA